jgi:hypothetical protein
MIELLPAQCNIFDCMQAEGTRSILQVFDADCYEFRTKSGQTSTTMTSTKRDDVDSLALSLSDGINRSVGAVLLVHRLEHEHVLLLHDRVTDVFRLPGGKISHGENIEDSLHRTLRLDLAPNDFPDIVWKVQGYLGCWWQPQLSSSELPHVLSQVSRPKEVSGMQFSCLNYFVFSNQSFVGRV